MKQGIDYRITQIGDFKYQVCNKCHTVNFANFECPNCRKAMRVRAGAYMHSILDAVDKRQGVCSKIKGEVDYGTRKIRPRQHL